MRERGDENFLLCLLIFHVAHFRIILGIEINLLLLRRDAELKKPKHKNAFCDEMFDVAEHELINF